MKYLITGANSQIGFDIAKELRKKGENKILALSNNYFDITNKAKVIEIVKNYKPDVIFHCEELKNSNKKSEKDLYKINVLGTRNITDASLIVAAKIVYLSTTKVFDGEKNIPYTEYDYVNPKNMYGKTKLLGENEIKRNPNNFIIRTSKLFGKNEMCFINKLLMMCDKLNTIDVVNDRIIALTYTVDLANKLIDISRTEKYGIYNVTNDNECSYIDIVNFISSLLKKDIIINELSTKEYLEKRNLNTNYNINNVILDTTKLEKQGFSKLPSWQDAIKRFYSEFTNKKSFVK